MYKRKSGQHKEISDYLSFNSIELNVDTRYAYFFRNNTSKLACLGFLC